MRKRTIKAAAKPERVVAMSAAVSIAAAKPEEKGPRKFSVSAYTGGAMNLEGWDLPVVVDLEGLEPGKSLVANLDHKTSQRVGHVTDKINDGKSLQLSGVVSAATASAKEVVESADSGFVWQASIEAKPTKILEIKAGKKAQVNGQSFDGPLYHVKTSTLKGFAFVSHGADDNTEVIIAASAASKKEHQMKPEVQAWAESMGIDVNNASDDQVATIEANFAGKDAAKKKPRTKSSDVLAQAREEEERREQIADICAQAIADNPGRGSDFISTLETLSEKAIEAKWDVAKFELEMLRATRPQAHTVFRSAGRDDRMSNRVIEAALCVQGRLTDVEKTFDDQTLQAAHDKFPNGIGLKQLFLLCAEANGYRGSYSSQITIEVQRAAFGLVGNRQPIHAQGWSTLSIATIISNTANKYLRDGWNNVDNTFMEIATIRNVSDFKEITTISLTGDLMFEKVGAAGEIKHGTLGETTYGNKADTYAKMLAITRQDMINDDAGVLTAVPKRLGRGSKLKLNDIGWTAFLNNSAFFTAGRANVNTGVADMTAAGLAATEAIFLAQNDPDGKPLGAMAAVLLVPTALKGAADTLMTSERMLGTSGPDGNIWKGRFKVLSSPYMSNSSYTGYSAAAWYMLADKNDLPVVEIAALNGRVEPVVETADADFNVLGVQMRGYSDVGVRLQEYRAGVRADGGSS